MYTDTENIKSCYPYLVLGAWGNTLLKPVNCFIQDIRVHKFQIQRSTHFS